MADQRFRPNERLKHATEYERVYAARCRAQGQYLRLHACGNGLLYSRLGLAVGKQWGDAHVRNRIKRWFREAFRLTKSQRPVGMDVIMVPVRLDGMSLEAVKSELIDLAKRVAARLRLPPAS